MPRAPLGRGRQAESSGWRPLERLSMFFSVKPPGRGEGRGCNVRLEVGMVVKERVAAMAFASGKGSSIFILLRYLRAFP